MRTPWPTGCVCTTSGRGPQPLRREDRAPFPPLPTLSGSSDQGLLAGPSRLYGEGVTITGDETDHRLVTERRGHVLLIRMERPAKRNAVDAAMTAALDAALNTLEDDP